MKRTEFIGLLLALALLGGCKKPGGTASAVQGEKAVESPASGTFESTLPREAQPRLPTLRLWLGAAELTAELAVTGEQQRTGMMFRTNMPENEAMLFVSQAPERRGFWMMNCYIPLSLAYIDPEGVILEIHDLQPHNTNSVESASDRIQFVLETPQGWFQRHNVNTGAVVRTERGSLLDTFFKNK